MEREFDTVKVLTYYSHEGKKRDYLLKGNWLQSAESADIHCNPKGSSKSLKKTCSKPKGSEAEERIFTDRCFVRGHRA